MSGFRNTNLKPDQVIAKAEEYIKLNKQKLALEKLKELFKARKRQWTEDHEKAMKLLVKTSISMRKNLKDDLQTYRYFTRDEKEKPTLQNVLDFVVREAEEQINMAESKQDETEVVVDDESPESLIMKAVCGDESKDRINREVLTPWVRYLSECYKNCLDCCLKNPDHEDTFHRLASKAFSFARRHKQKIAFKNNFCRLVREHWISMNALNAQQAKDRMAIVTEQQRDPSPNNKFNLMVKALLDQLDVAVAFDNWLEAYKAIEEIASRFEYFKVKPNPEIMIPYYTQLAQIFWVSRNWLFHAYALIKLFDTKKDQETLEGKKKDKDPKRLEAITAERQHLANKVVTAVMCIPFWKQDRVTCITPFITDPQREKATKMISLMGAAKPPTRDSLLSDLKGKNHILFDLASPEVKAFFNLVEKNVQPLNLADKVAPVFKWLNENNLGDYTDDLQLVSAVSVIVASSKVYSTLSLDSLRHMCRFYEKMDLEALLVEVARSPRAQVGLCIDHQSSSIKFEDANISPDILSSTLPMLRKRLAVVNKMIMAQSAEGEAQQKKIQERQGLLLKRVMHGLDEERMAIIKRKGIIEFKKEKAEEAAEQKKQDIIEKREAEKAKQLNEEKKRIEEEKQRRAKIEEEEKKRKKNADQTQVVIKALKQSQIKTAAIEKKISRGEKMDTDTLMEHGKKLMIEAKEKAEQKRLKEWHNVHWFERACRELEAPMIRESHTTRLDALKEAYETRKDNTLSQMKKDWEEAHAHKKRLIRMVPFMDSFYEDVMNSRMKAPRMLMRAEKHVKDEIQHQEMMAKAGRSEAPAAAVASTPAAGSSSSPTSAAKPSAAFMEGNWRSGPAAASSTEEAAPAAESSPKKAAFKARGPSINLGGAAAPAAEEKAPAPAEETPAPAAAEEKKPEKKAWGSARKGGFKIDL